MVVFNACHLDLDQLLPLSLSLVTSGQTVAHMHTHYLYSDLLHHHWSLSYAWSILYNHCLLHHAAHPILLSPNLPPRSSTDELTYVEISPLPWSLFRQLCGCLLNYPISPMIRSSTPAGFKYIFKVETLIFTNDGSFPSLHWQVGQKWLWYLGFRCQNMACRAGLHVPPHYQGQLCNVWPPIILIISNQQLL